MRTKPLTTVDRLAYTPRSAATGRRLAWPRDEVEVVSGEPWGRGQDRQGVVRYRGRLYNVKAEPCGLGCFCDASVEEVPAGEQAA